MRRPRRRWRTNMHMAACHRYGNALWRVPMSTRRRIAREIKLAAKKKRLAEVVT